MVGAAATAIATRVNLPISVALVWITNPITIPPMFYSTYKFGAWILNEPPQDLAFELSIEWLTESLAGIWQPLILGSLLCGIISAVLGYLLIRGLWRWHIISHIQKRKERRNRDC
jgi:uncharacterized protein (DUF2062 family)